MLLIKIFVLLLGLLKEGVLFLEMHGFNMNILCCMKNRKSQLKKDLRETLLSSFWWFFLKSMLFLLRTAQNFSKFHQKLSSKWTEVK